MSRTIADAILQARYIVQDTRELSRRHSDEKLVAYFNNALSDAYKVRPDLFFISGQSDTSWSDLPLYTVSDIDSPFPLDGRYFTPFVDYIAGYVGMEDDEYANDGRAVGLLQRFQAKLIAQGG